VHIRHLTGVGAKERSAPAREIKDGAIAHNQEPKLTVFYPGSARGRIMWSSGEGVRKGWWGRVQMAERSVTGRKQWGEKEYLVQGRGGVEVWY